MVRREHIIIVRIDSDRSTADLVGEIQSNLEYENITAKTFVVSESLKRAIVEEGGREGE
jgi:hypothetical protein